VFPKFRSFSKSDGVASSPQQPRSPLTTINLSKVPSSRPLGEYIASRERHISAIITSQSVAGSDTTVSGLDSFMQRVTDKEIIDAAKKKPKQVIKSKGAVQSAK
jgi:hypothetical protein